MLNQKRISRRNFLQIIAVGVVANATAKLSFDALTAAEAVAATRILMGTVVNLAVISEDKVTAQNAIEATFNRMAELEDVLSHFKSESQLSQLNQNGHIYEAHPALLALIDQAHQLSELTTGGFDITIKPLLELYQQHQTTASLPSATEIADTLEKVDYRQIKVNGDQIAFARPGMAITLDGIAKGFIVDEGVLELKQAGLNNVMVEAGGDLLVSGQKSAGESWQIGLQSPRRSQPGLLARLTVRNQAIATSGDYLQAFTTDLRQHHILDPRTGYSSPALASATIIAPSAVLADGLATATMVLGLEDGLALVNRLPDCGACLVDKDLHQFSVGLNDRI